MASQKFIRTKAQSNSPRSARESSSQHQPYCTAPLEPYLDDSSLKSYTCLKDLIPPTHGGSKNVNPYLTGLTIQSAYEIPITNMLVRKAAWGYLQPMALPPDEFSSNTTPMEHILCLASPVRACLRFVRRNIINKIVSVFEKLSGAIHLDPSSTLLG